MFQREFSEFFDSVVDHERQTLVEKARDYASTTDRLWNFKRGAEIVGTTPLLCLWGYLGKHLTSISDICHGSKASRETIREKIGDARNYLILLEALLVDELEHKSLQQGQVMMTNQIPN